MPAVCACCGRRSETTQRVVATRVEGTRVIRTKTSWWDIPYCQACCAHDRAWPSLSPLAILILTAFTCGIYLVFYFQHRQRALAMCGPSCARPQRAISYLGWHGTVHRFDIRQPIFAHAFAVANAKKLVGADAETRRLLDAPPPAAPPPLVPVPRVTASRTSQPAIEPQAPPPTVVMYRPAPRVAEPLPVPKKAKTGFVGPHEVVTVAGRTLQGPLAYVGQDDRNADASTIITSLRVTSPAGAEDLPYWPTYAGATPAQRAAYLDWHASGRADPQTQIGYVFLHFYGLERRLLVDRADLDTIHVELKRLLSIYGTRSTFRGYASALLAFVAMPMIPTMSEDVAYAWLGDLRTGHPTARDGLLAWFHVHQRPLPARVAMQVASAAEGSKRGVAVTRARAELEDLFEIRYRERYGDGLRLEAAKRPETIAYHAGNPSLLSAARKLSVQIPHVLGRSAQFSPVIELWNDCVADLRKLGSKRNGDGASPLTADAWLALPAELRADYEHPDRDAWDSAVAKAPQMGAFRVLTAGKLVKLAGVAADGRITAARLRRAAETAGHLGYAVEPDARVHAQTLAASAELAIWSTPTASPPDAGVWRSVSVMLSLSMSIAFADGQVSDEEAHTVHSLISNLFPLDDAMRTRLAALRQLLERAPLRVTALARKLKESRTSDELAKIGRVLVTVAAVDGVITEDEHRALKNLYKAMGVSAGELAKAIAGSGARLESDATIKARDGQPATGGEAIPQPPDASGPTLNRAAIDAILAETREVASILSAVLDDEDAGDESAPVASPVGGVPTDTDWPGLDARYHGVLRELLTRRTWTMAEVRAMASRSKLMPGAVLEAVNAWSDERFGDYVIEDAGDWQINAQLLERATA